MQMVAAQHAGPSSAVLPAPAAAPARMRAQARPAVLPPTFSAVNTSNAFNLLQVS